MIFRSDSDDVIDGAPPLLEAGRRKRKVVAHPRGTVSSDENEDDDDDDVRPFKKCPSRSRWRLLLLLSLYLVYFIRFSVTMFPIFYL